jgi:methionine aminotransferase
MEARGQIGSKLPAVGTTIFTIMSHLSHEYKAINLAQGFPDFPCSPQLVSLVSESMKKGLNQYAPMAGIFPLREMISEKTRQQYHIDVSPEKEITVTCGATEASYAAITALIQKNDEVLIFEPAFDCYVPAIELCGGKPVFVELHYPEYKIDWPAVKTKISPQTKMIIINSPHNPTGSAWSSKDLDELAKLVKGTNIIILSDEVYEHIIFDQQIHQSVLLRPDLRERSLVISSFGKTFHTTGWRMGYCIAPEYLTIEFRKVHQYLTFSAPTPMQYALADFLKNKEEYLQLPAFFQKKRDFFLGMMASSKFKFIPSSGTYFQLMSYKNISQENDIDYAARLTKETGVASIPISVFFNNKRDDKILRFCFAKENDTLERAAEKLCRI